MLLNSNPLLGYVKWVVVIVIESNVRQIMKIIYFLLVWCLFWFSCDQERKNCSDYSPAECVTATPASNRVCVLSHNHCVDEQITAKDFDELEEMNSRTCEKGFEGQNIFVDITAKGGGKALEVLKNIRKSGMKKCHVGVACLVNFSIGAANESDRIVLIDYDPVVVKFNRLARALLISSPDRETFKTNLVQASKHDPDIAKRKLYPVTKQGTWAVDNLSFILNIDESFLSNDHDFQWIKKLAVEKKIHIILGSIYDSELITVLAKLIKDECVLDTLFVSNIYDWNENETNRKLLAKNMLALSHDQTKIVEVLPIPKGQYNVNIVYAKDPQSQERYSPVIMRGNSASRRTKYPAAPLLVD